MSGETVYGIGGLVPVHPSQNRIEEWDVDSNSYTQWDTSGKVVTQRSLTLDEMTRYIQSSILPVDKLQVLEKSLTDLKTELITKGVIDASVDPTPTVVMAVAVPTPVKVSFFKKIFNR